MNSSDEEEGEIISDDENNGPQETPKEDKRVSDDKKTAEPRPMSIGDIAARIQEQNALRMASSLDRMQHDDDRSRKRHHKKEKRRRRNSHSEEDSPHRKHVSITPRIHPRGTHHSDGYRTPVQVVQVHIRIPSSV